LGRWLALTEWLFNYMAGVQLNVIYLMNVAEDAGLSTLREVTTFDAWHPRARVPRLMPGGDLHGLEPIAIPSA
jgi:hypothetical protein